MTGMTAYSRLQEKEFSRETQYGYEAVKHQRFVGTGYFDQIQQVISGGLASTTAWAGSTEAEQFVERKSPMRSEHDPDSACRPMRDRCPQIPVTVDLGPEEMLLPSGD